MTGRVPRLIKKCEMTVVDFATGLPDNTKFTPGVVLTIDPLSVEVSEEEEISAQIVAQFISNEAAQEVEKMREPVMFGGSVIDKYNLDIDSGYKMIVRVSYLKEVIRSNEDGVGDISDIMLNVAEEGRNVVPSLQKIIETGLDVSDE